MKTVVFRCKLDNLTCANEQELLTLMTRIGAAIQSVHADAMIHPTMDVLSSVEVSSNIAGAGGCDGYMDVKRANGSHEYYYTPNDGTNVQITKEQYDAAHASPDSQANLESARRVAGVH